MTERLSLEKKISNLKKTTEILLALPECFILPNNWKLRELLIHLWSWDVQISKLCEAKISKKLEKFQYDHEKLKMDYIKWNDYIIEKNSRKSFTEAKKLFKETREKLIEYFEKLLQLPEYIKDQKSDKRTENIFELWNHDKHHLEAGHIKCLFD